MTIFKKEIPTQVIRISIIVSIFILIISFKMISASIVKMKIDKILGTAKEYVTYANVSMDLFGFDVHIDDIKIALPGEKPLLIDEMVVKSFDSNNVLPHYMNIKMKGVQNLFQVAQINPTLAKIGLELKQKMNKSDLILNYKYENEQKMLDVKEMSVEIEDMAKISYETKIYNVLAMEYFTMQLNFAPQTLKYGPTHIQIKNDSLVEAFMEMNAKDANLSLESYKNDLFAKEQQKIDTAKALSQKFEVALDEAWLSFLKNPKSFDFQTAPKQPLPLILFGEIRSRDGMLRQVDPKFTVN